MTRKTRYFMGGSAAILVAGLGTGLVAYYVGFPAGAFQSQGGPADLQLVPRNVTLLANANVQFANSTLTRDGSNREPNRVAGLEL